MSRSVDYYFAPQSPWTYLGHERFTAILRASGATVRVLPIDLGGKVFPISGGLPVGKRGLVAYKRVGSNVADVNAFRFLKA